MQGFDRREFLVQSAGALTAVALTPVLEAATRLRVPLEVGIVGVGRQGRAIVAELEKIEGVKVGAFCDTEQARVDWGTRRVPGSQGFTDHRAMIDGAKGVSAVIVATPTHLHKQIVLDLLGAGKHVYCEMPMAHTLEDARAIAGAARGSKGVFHCGLEGRSNPIYKLARTFFKSDSVRDLCSMRAQHYQKTTWRFAGATPEREKALNWRLEPDISIGLPGELGTHQFDVMCWYRDQYPTTISGYGYVAIHQDGRTIADTVALRLNWPDKRYLCYEATLCNSFQGRHEIFHGENAAIKLAWSHGWMFKEADAPTQGWEVYANKQQFANDEGITLIADATKLASRGQLKEGVGLPNPALYSALSDFVKSVSEGTPSVAPADAGLRATVLGILSHKAVVTGQEQRVPEELMK